MSYSITRARSHADALFATLNQYANDGKDCPASAPLCILAGVNPASGIKKPILNLVKRCIVRMSEDGEWRYITIAKTGKTTRIPMRAPRKPVVPTSHEVQPVYVDRDPCHVCGIRKDLCEGHGIKPVMYIPSNLWKELSRGID